jgi:hypothetical protein
MDLQEVGWGHELDLYGSGWEKLLTSILSLTAKQRAGETHR